MIYCFLVDASPLGAPPVLLQDHGRNKEYATQSTTMLTLCLLALIVGRIGAQRWNPNWGRCRKTRMKQNLGQVPHTAYGNRAHRFTLNQTNSYNPLYIVCCRRKTYSIF